MTTKDKTGDKLVASIRRTKAGATKTGGEPKAEPAAPRRKTAAATKPAPARRPAATGKKPPRDPYQYHGRVWPD